MRFFVAPQNISGNRAVLGEDETRHALKVLRLKPGDGVVLFDGQGRSYQACLESVQGGCLVAALIRAEPCDTAPPLYIHLVQGLPKGDKMDLIVQKAVEIGVDSIYPLQARRCVSQVREAASSDKKLQRWGLIAREACKQSGRNRVPGIKPPLRLPQLLSAIGGSPGVVLYEQELRIGYRQILQALIPLCREKDLFILVGPEGGWESGEIKEMSEKGLYTASLGSVKLRTETAGLVAAALALYEAGAWGCPGNGG